MGIFNSAELHSPSAACYPPYGSTLVVVFVVATAADGIVAQ